MQSYSGTTDVLRCFDCNSEFSSATTLLQHFANHFSKNNENNELVTLFCEIMSRLHRCSPAYIRKKLKLKPSLEQSWKHCGQSESWVESSSGTCSNVSDTMTKEDGVECEAGRTSQGRDVDSVPISNILTEIGARAKNRRQNLSVSGDIMLVECGLQRRLEKCIVKLSLRQKNSPRVQCRNVTGEDMLTPTHLTQSLSYRLPKLPNTNAVNFCFLTTNGIAGHPGIPHAKVKNVSCRKQASPRKVVHRRTGISGKDAGEFFCRGYDDEAFQSSMPLCEDADVGNCVPSVSDRADCKTGSGKKKYQCHLCTKTFGWSTDLKRHILTHTGERPFKCGLCQATFTRNFLLQKHEAKFHDMKVQTSATTKNSLVGRETDSSDNGGSSTRRKLVQYKQSIAAKLGNTIDLKKTELLKVSKSKSSSAAKSSLYKKGTDTETELVLPS